MITFNLPIQLTDNDKKMILEFQRVQSSMIRTAYKQAQYECTEISVRQKVRDRFKDQLDSWFQQSAVKYGIGMFKSDHETGRSGRIFGGKGNLIRRAKRLISKEEWKQKRLLPLYLIGEAPAKGNRKFEFHEEYEINAAYSSTIGNILHPKLPDPIAASTEIAQRGYRLVILKNKQFYPKLPAVSYLEDLWKETKIPLVETWKEQHSWVKNSKLKYRVPVPDESVFRIFQSPASLVGVL
jgi:hypothetical protein